MAIRESVAAAASLRNALDEPASAETGEVVRHRLPRDAEGVREVGGVARCFAQREQDAGAGGVRQRMPEAGDGGRVGEEARAVVTPLLYRKAEFKKT